MNARGKNVLVVDDEDYVREVVSDALSAEGFTCTTAANGEEALERLSDSVPERFVSVVSDISMPEMDGLELAHKIHELDSDLPIIILTGYPTLETARDGYEHGVYQYLTKPINIEELATCVERAAEFARLVRADKHRKEELELEVKRRTEDLEFQTKALEISHTRVASVIEEANFGLLVLGQSDEVFLVNRRAEELLRMLPEFRNKSFEKPYREIFPPETTEKIAQVVDAVRASGDVQELPAVSIGPSTVMDLVSYPVMVKDTISAVVVAANDVTEKKRLEEQLLHSSKLAAIGELAAGVAHEINNPVGFVMSNTNTMEEYLKDITEMLGKYRRLRTSETSERDALSKEIEAFEAEIDIDFVMNDMAKISMENKAGLQRVAKIIKDLKSFAHIDEAVTSLADVNALLEDTLNLVRNEIKYKAEVVREYGEVGPIECHAGQLEQVFMNIMVNAAQAIEGKGEIAVKTSQKDGEVVVQISDTGKGIPEDVMPRLFEPFFTTKEVGEGTGMGLSIAYVIVEKHNGSIEAESEVGKGTTFTIRLPFESGVGTRKNEG